MGSLLKSILETKTGKGGLASLAVSAGIFFLKNVLKKKGIKTNIKFLTHSLLRHKTEDKSLRNESLRQANAIKKIAANHNAPFGRVAVDGVPGSGKSSLARALAQVMDIKNICLDHQNMDEPLSFEESAAIYEHHRLFRTQDMDCFDAIIYIDQPVNIAKQNILKRQRGAYLVDIMDFDLMKRIGEKAFSLADSQAISVPDSFLKMKFRPDKGYGDMANLAGELRAKSSDGSVKTDLNKEQQIFLSVEGVAKKGFISYINPQAYKQELFSALLDAMESVEKGSRGKKRWK